MSNNSWKQYGGISKMDNFNTINASTIIADQFISRSVRPQYQLLNGTFEVTDDLISGNSTYSGVDLFSNRDIYANNKLFFGNNTFAKEGMNLPALTDISKNTYAYMYGNEFNIGINTNLPKTIFNITGTIDSITDILTVESKNVYIRNIIAQNKNKRGIVVDSDDASSNILFYNDGSTDSTNVPNATIKYQTDGILTTQTGNHILSTAREIQSDSSGGTLLMNSTGTSLSSSGYLLVDISGQIHFNTDTGYIFDAYNDFIVNCSGTLLSFNDISSNINTTGDIILLSKGQDGLGGNIILDSSGGVIEFTSGDIKLNTLLKFSPPERGISNELLHNETMTIYDNDNSLFLPNVYNDPSILTGSAATFIGKDPSANSFIFMNPATRKDGAAFGGGMAPYDSTRSVTMIGMTDSSGEYISSQITVSSTNKHKYTSTMGINTYKPRTENYVLDVNGPIHLGNGEINTIADNTYEITHMNFSNTDPEYGIAVGSPSTKSTGEVDDDDVPIATYKQLLLYTNDSGKTWTKSDIFLSTSINTDTPTSVRHVHVFNNLYSAIAATGNYLFLSKEATWYRLQISGSGFAIPTVDFKTINIISISNGDNTHRILITYDAGVNPNDSSDAWTAGIYYFDCSLVALFNTAISNTIDAVIEFTSKATLLFDIISASIGSAINETPPSYVYYAGANGIARYKHSDSSITNTNTSPYNNIYALDDSNAIAVGNNIISYTINGTVWNHIIPSTHTNLNTTMVLNSVFIQSLSNAVAVGSSGAIIYSTDWQNGVWQMVPDNLLNSSGMGDRIRGSENNLKSISMPDINTMIIADVIDPFVGDASSPHNFTESKLGYSKIQYCFLPNLFNRVDNNVLDISGNIVIDGDIILAGNLVTDSDVVFNQDLMVNGDVVFNQNLNVGGDVSFNGNVDISGELRATYNRSLTNYIINTTVNDYEFIVTTDLSMNGRLWVGEDASFNSNIDISGNVAIGKHNPLVTLDISANDAIRLPVGTTIQRPIFKNNGGYLQITGGTVTTETEQLTTSDISGYIGSIRYNETNKQFEGFGPGDSWGSLGGVINVAQNTKITAESSPAATNNELRFYTATGNSSNTNDTVERMRIKDNGDISMNHNLTVGGTLDVTGATAIATGGGVVNISKSGIMTTVKGSLNVDQAVTLDTTLDVTGATAIATGGGVVNISKSGIMTTVKGSLNVVQAVTLDTTLDVTGKVTIGGDAAAATTTTVNLEVNGQVKASQFNAISDSRFKTNIQPVTDSLSVINQLNGMSFTWIGDDTNKPVLGLIAQEVEKVLPEIVNTSTTENEQGFNQKSLHYDGLFPHLIESVKTLSKENETLKTKVNTLESTVGSLESKLEMIMKHLNL